MAKKADLLAQARELGLVVSERNTIAEIEALIAGKDGQKTAEATTAKAGKRSAKALREAEAEAAKQTRKTEPADKQPVTKPERRSRLERRGKNYREVSKKIEQGRYYPLDQALDLARQTNPSKIDATVEIHVRLGVDPRQADQNIRTTVTLPNGTGKNVRVAVFAPAEDVVIAKEAGADLAGEDEIQTLLEKGNLPFDVLIATPKLMPKLGRFARLLGPRGLMPNPKSGTVATDVAKAVKEAKAGRIEYRVDKQAIVHLGVGKTSFSTEQLLENAKTFFSSLESVRPSSLKGAYIQSVSVSTTHGPGIKIDLTSL